MRIVHVTPGYWPELGGVERHVQDVSEALARLGHHVVVVATTPDARLPRHELVGGVEVRRLPAIGPQHYRLPLGLMRYLARQRFDVVHAHNYHALPMLCAALSAGARCVISPYYHGRAHSRAADALHRLYRPLGRLALRRAAGIVCLSAGEANLVVRNLMVARERIAVIPVGYADGFRRAPQNWGEVLVGGQRAPLVGRVSMDMTMINVTNIPGVRIGDEVVLIGRQGDEAISADAVARQLGTISYEVVSTILARVPRV